VVLGARDLEVVAERRRRRSRRALAAAAAGQQRRDGDGDGDCERKRRRARPRTPRPGGGGGGGGGGARRIELTADRSREALSLPVYGCCWQMLPSGGVKHKVEQRVLCLIYPRNHTGRTVCLG
jgi:hypothetical protein